MTWFRRHKQKQLFPKFQLIPSLCLKLYMIYVHWHCSIDYSVKLNLVDENLSENCFYFTLKWFLLNSFGESCFLEEKQTDAKKVNFFESSLYIKSGSMPLTNFTIIITHTWFFFKYRSINFYLGFKIPSNSKMKVICNLQNKLVWNWIIEHKNNSHKIELFCPRQICQSHVLQHNMCANNLRTYCLHAKW